MKTLRLLIKDKRSYIETILKKYDHKTSVIFALECAKIANSISKEDIECIKAVEAWLEDPSEENYKRCKITADRAAAPLRLSSAPYAAYAVYYNNYNTSAAWSAYHAANRKNFWKKVFDILDEVLETEQRKV